MYSKVLVNVPIGMISQIEKIGGQKFSQINDGAAYGIEIDCKVNRFLVGERKKNMNEFILGCSTVVFWYCERTKTST